MKEPNQSKNKIEISDYMDTRVVSDAKVLKDSKVYNNMRIELNSANSYELPKEINTITSKTIGIDEHPHTRSKKSKGMHSPMGISQYSYINQPGSYKRNFSKYNDDNVSIAIERFESYERHKKKLEEIKRKESPLSKRKLHNEHAFGNHTSLVPMDSTTNNTVSQMDQYGSSSVIGTAMPHSVSQKTLKGVSAMDHKSR